MAKTHLPLANSVPSVISGRADAALPTCAGVLPALETEMENDNWMSEGKQPRVLKEGNSATMVSVEEYKNDPLYPRIVRAVVPLLARGKVVAPVDVLVGMGILEKSKLEDWRFGRVPYLEKVITCNLTRLSRILRVLRYHCHDLKLVPSVTVYKRWGKGCKQQLRFTKTGDVKIEEAYSRHFVWSGKGPFHMPVSRREKDSRGSEIDEGK